MGSPIGRALSEESSVTNKRDAGSGGRWGSSPVRCVERRLGRRRFFTAVGSGLAGGDVAFDQGVGVEAGEQRVLGGEGEEADDSLAAVDADRVEAVDVLAVLALAQGPELLDAGVDPLDAVRVEQGEGFALDVGLSQFAGESRFGLGEGRSGGVRARARRARCTTRGA